MKRFVISISLLLVVSAMFISCNKDSAGTPIGSYPQKIVGTWQLVQWDYHYQGEVESRQDDVETCYIFKKNGKMSMTSSRSPYMNNVEYDYSLSGNHITIKAGMDQTYDIIKLTDTEMQFQVGGNSWIIGMLNSLANAFEDTGRQCDKVDMFFTKK